MVFMGFCFGKISPFPKKWEGGKIERGTCFI
jgi:hypothetical protein